MGRLIGGMSHRETFREETFRRNASTCAGLKAAVLECGGLPPLSKAGASSRTPERSGDGVGAIPESPLPHANGGSGAPSRAGLVAAALGCGQRAFPPI